jgi:putative nucleotidyltransferase with HDIG domain
VNNPDLTPEQLVKTVKDLVTLPEIALRIAKMVNDPESSASDIAREIGKDAAVTARLLRIANSPMFGHSQHIASVSRAVTVIGLRQVRDLTVGLTTMRAFAGIPNELVTMESFWRHSVLCAVAAGHLAARAKAGNGETAFVAGLLHDIGQLVLFGRAPDLARQALLMSVDSVDDLDLHLCERRIFGFDHAAVGNALAKNWALPVALAECIQFHHEPERAQAQHSAEVAIVHVANSVAVLAEIGSTDFRDASPISASALHALALDSAAVMQVIRQTQESAADMLPLLVAA